MLMVYLYQSSISSFLKIMLWHTVYQDLSKTICIFILRVLLNYKYVINKYRDLTSLYCGSWLGGLSQGVKLFLCLVLAPAVHRRLGKEDGCEAERAKTNWMKEKVVPSIMELNMHLVQESGKLIQQEDLAGAQLLLRALKVISNNVPEFQQCLVSCIHLSSTKKKKKKKWRFLHFCILNLV